MSDLLIGSANRGIVLPLAKLQDGKREQGGFLRG